MGHTCTSDQIKKEHNHLRYTLDFDNVMSFGRQKAPLDYLISFSNKEEVPLKRRRRGNEHGQRYMPKIK